MPISDRLLKLAGAAALALLPGVAAAQDAMFDQAFDSAAGVMAAPAEPGYPGNPLQGGASFSMAFSYEGGVSSEQFLSTLEAAAEAGSPLALWRLGVMYENGEGVAADPARAFAYFERIADENADTPPRSLEADIIAQSFLKVSQYYRNGLPAAGVEINLPRARAMLLHAATYFADAEAQYQVGLLYLVDGEFGRNPIQSVRWFRLAAQKGHFGAQAKLGELLLKGDQGFAPEPVEGLMWLTLAMRGAMGTADEVWIRPLADEALSLASAETRERALRNADMLGPQLGG